jgi:uncharacterized protein (TIGR03435 family)
VSPRADWVKTVDNAMQGGFLIGDRYELRRATMLDLIRVAYNVDADKIYGGPSWLDYGRFEIVAKTQPGTGPASLRLMLQSLLEERFHLAVKMETRDVPGYVLSKGKGELKVKAAEGNSRAACQTQISMEGGVPSPTFQCRGVTMETFAQSLRRGLSGPLGNRPVLDSTGIEGAWDLDVQIRRASGFGEHRPGRWCSRRRGQARPETRTLESAAAGPGRGERE